MILSDSELQILRNPLRNVNNGLLKDPRNSWETEHSQGLFLKTTSHYWQIKMREQWASYILQVNTGPVLWLGNILELLFL